VFYFSANENPRTASCDERKLHNWRARNNQLGHDPHASQPLKAWIDASQPLEGWIWTPILTWAGLEAVGLHPPEHLPGRNDPVPGFRAPGLGGTASVVGVVDGVLVVRQHVHYFAVPHDLQRKTANKAARQDIY